MQGCFIMYDQRGRDRSGKQKPNGCLRLTLAYSQSRDELCILKLEAESDSGLCVVGE